ncbi:MAG: hypothetical protein WCD76_17950 [Pyrinomonadaceae bacterium]
MIPTVEARLLHAQAQATTRAGLPARKLPSADKVVGDYVKALGGKRNVAGLRDATYEWDVRRADGVEGTARTSWKSPSSSRTDVVLAGIERDEAANGRSAWTRESDGRLRTLTDEEALAAKLGALLDAGRMIDLKKQNVLARTVSLEDVGGEAAYLVEFTTRAGAHLQYWFSTANKFPLRIRDTARGLDLRFFDWRGGAQTPSQPSPHRVEVLRAGSESLTFVLREARYNTGLAETLFDPPGDSALDVPALLRELSRNQNDVDKRINDYTFKRKKTERKLNDKGVVTKETVTVHDIYPIAGYGWIRKLVSENGIPLSPERAAKEEKRAGEELEKAEREMPKLEAKREQQRAERAAKKNRDGHTDADTSDDDDVEISTILRACELVSPRRERFRERDTIVFDFRARVGFRPSTRAESVVSKLAGTIWIDPVDKQVMRLEARFVESYKVGGGLLATLKPGASFTFEQTRLPDGVWLPQFAQINASARIMLFAGVNINETHEYSDFKRFSTKTGDATLDAPKAPPH